MNRTRRSILKTIALCAAGLAFAPCLSHAQDKPSAQRPNIVFVFGDDFGADGLGCYGSEFFKHDTPRLDALASGGVRFTRCYASALCTPTRQQLATGQYAFRNGVIDLDGGLNWETPDRPKLTQMLKDAGYVTCLIGKAYGHAGEPDEALGGWSYWDKDPSKWGIKGPSTLTPDAYEYMPAAHLDFALDFITRHRPRPETNHRPFYLLLGLNNPHVPIQRTPETPPGVTNVFDLYRDNIRFIDRVAGALVDKLRELDCLDNTLFVFSGDNGSLTADQGKTLQSPILDARSGKYRKLDAGKGDRDRNREGTALVPLVVHWPRGIAPARTGNVLNELVDFTDFLPTFAEIAGAKMPPNWQLDGQSFAPLLRGDPGYRPREWAFHQIRGKWCLRGDKYRLDEDGRFFDMGDAPFGMTELKTLTPEQQSIRDRYQAVLDRLDPANGPTFEGYMDHMLQTPEAEWKMRYFGQGSRPGNSWFTAISGDAADPDNDGVPNIFERAFGWEPKAGANKMPAPQRQADGSFTLAIPQVENNNVRVRVAVSGDGRDWKDVPLTGKSPCTVTVTPPAGPAPALRLSAERISREGRTKAAGCHFRSGHPAPVNYAVELR